jgi:hypothetical protein
MRKLIGLAFVLAACSKPETPATDTTATMTPPAPVMLTAADVSGKWSGMSG